MTGWAVVASAVVLAAGRAAAQLPDPPPSYGGPAVEPETSESADASPVAAVPPVEPPAPDASPLDVCFDERDLLEGDVAPPGVAPCTRSTYEIVELYIYAGIYGLSSGAFLGDRLRFDEAMTSVTAALFGAGAVLGVVALDSGAGADPGVPSTLSSGLLLGFWESFIVAAATTDGDPFANLSGPVFLGVTTGSLGLSILAAFTLRPTVAQNHFVRSGALWGGFFAGMLNLIGDEDDRLDGARVIFTGYNAGIVAAGILTAVMPVHRTQVLYVDAGGILGVVAGGAIAGAFDANGERVIGWSLGLGALAGIGLAWYLSLPSPAVAQPGAPASTSVADRLRFTATPTEGGALVGAAAAF
jgi:hypothetical protein